MIRTAFDIPRAASSAACLTPNLRPPFPGQRSDVLVAPDWGKGCGGGRGVGEFPFIFSLTQAQDDQEWGVEKGVGEERGGMVSWLLRKALRSQGDWSRGACGTISFFVVGSCTCALRHPWPPPTQCPEQPSHPVVTTNKTSLDITQCPLEG